MNYSIRRLDGGDFASFRALRLDALRLHPEAFGSSFEEELAEAPDVLERRFLLPPSVTFGVFCDGALVGMAGLLRQTRIKTRHKGDVYGVYVDAAHRGGGLANALVAAVIAEARDAGLRVLHLTVTAGNDAARRTYEHLGFAHFATERRGLAIDDVFYDVEHMAMEL